MLEMICIVCPNGCHLMIDDDLNVSGNICKRGQEFALQEIQNPQRSVTTTCKTSFVDVPVVPVKTDGTVNKDLMCKVVEEINKVTISDNLKIGDVVIKNVLNTGVNVVMCTNILNKE